ncbi:hypothetical protein Tcan_00922, partial [Toxocara canis]
MIRIYSENISQQISYMITSTNHICASSSIRMFKKKTNNSTQYGIDRLTNYSGNRTIEAQMGICVNGRINSRHVNTVCQANLVTLFWTMQSANPSPSPASL